MAQPSGGSHHAGGPFICDICYEPYNTSTHNPLALPCMHTFCTSCVERVFKASSTPKCPTCKEQVPSGTTAATLRPNYALLQAMEHMQAMPAAAAARGETSSSATSTEGSPKTEIKCRSGHHLTAMSAASLSQLKRKQCDGCCAVLAIDGKVLHPCSYFTCEQCDYDLCTDCHEICKRMQLRQGPAFKRISAADYVTVVARYTSPLTPGKLGLVVETTGTPLIPIIAFYEVRDCETDKTWNYLPWALRKVWDEEATSHLIRPGDYVTLSDAACASSSSLPDGLAYVAEGPLAKGDLGRVIGDDGSRCRPWQVACLKSRCAYWYGTRALKKIPAADARARASQLKIQPGSVVRLTDTFRGTPDAARGPLRGGELGIVLTEDDDWSGRPYKVQKVKPNGQLTGDPSWYPIRALAVAPSEAVPALVQQRARVTATAASRAGSSRHVSSSQRSMPLPMPLLMLAMEHAMRVVSSDDSDSD